MVVGADQATVGANSQQGAAYVFTKSGSAWTKDPDRQAHRVRWRGGRHFGCSVSISGSTVAVGAPDATVGVNGQQGAAYVFTELRLCLKEPDRQAHRVRWRSGRFVRRHRLWQQGFHQRQHGSGRGANAWIGDTAQQGAAYVFGPSVLWVTGVSSTDANETYGLGATIPITVTFNEPVTVTGTPQLALNDGGVASYVSGRVLDADVRLHRCLWTEHERPGLRLDRCTHAQRRQYPGCGGQRGGAEPAEHRQRCFSNPGHHDLHFTRGHEASVRRRGPWQAARR